jgi:transposase-like protein
VSEDRKYSEEEAEAILKLAVDKGSFAGAMTHDQLVAAAGELGIAPETVEEAEREFRSRADDDAMKASYDRRVKADFWGHAATYLVVNAALVGFNLMSTGHVSWAIWSILGWGIAIALHAWESFVKSSDDYQKGLSKWRRKAGKRAATSGLAHELSRPTRRAAESEEDELSNLR